MKNYPVLIIGCGPVGLSLAVALAKKGIDIQIFEQTKVLSSEVRASSIHPSSLDMFEQWEVIDPVLEHGYKVDHLQYWAGYPFRLQCPQHILTRTLKPLIEKKQPGSVDMSHELIHVEDHGDYIERPLYL